MAINTRLKPRPPEYHPIAEIFHNSPLTPRAFTPSQLKALENVVEDSGEDIPEDLMKTAISRMDEIVSKGHAYGHWEDRERQPSVIEMAAEIMQQTLYRIKIRVRTDGPFVTSHAFAAAPSGTFSDLPEHAIPLVLSLNLFSGWEKRKLLISAKERSPEAVLQSCHDSIATCLVLLEMITKSVGSHRRSRLISQMLREF